MAENWESKAIQKASKAWWKAYKQGDKKGMERAKTTAKAIRKKQGYSLDGTKKYQTPTVQNQKKWESNPKNKGVVTTSTQSAKSKVGLEAGVCMSSMGKLTTLNQSRFREALSTGPKKPTTNTKTKVKRAGGARARRLASSPEPKQRALPDFVQSNLAQPPSLRLKFINEIINVSMGQSGFVQDPPVNNIRLNKHRKIVTPSGHTVKPHGKQRYRQETAEGVKQAIKDNAGARAIMGFHKGISLFPFESGISKTYGADTLDDLKSSKAYKAGEFAGIAAQYGVPYTGAARALGGVKAVEKTGTEIGKTLAFNLHRISAETAGKVGQSAARNLATDLAVGASLDLYNLGVKDNLRGSDLAKSMAASTAMNIGIGGAIEAAPLIKGLAKNKPAAAVLSPGGKVKYTSKGNLKPKAITPTPAKNADLQKERVSRIIQTRNWDEINNLPEMREARRRSTFTEPTIKIKTPERQTLRGQITDDLYEQGSFSGVDETGKELYNGIVKRDRRMDIIIGPPAAGKFSVLANPLSSKHRSRIIDSDMAKERLPEFDGGFGAGHVHEESAYITEDMLMDRATLNGDNIVIPWVGKTPDKIRALVQSAHDDGYSVYLHLNELHPDKAARRAVQRYIAAGRFVDPDYAKNVGWKPSETYDILKKEGIFDGYTKHSNDVPRGQKARLIEEYYPTRGARGMVQGRGRGLRPGDVQKKAGTQGEGGPTTKIAGQEPASSFPEKVAEDARYRLFIDFMRKRYGEGFAWSEITEGEWTKYKQKGAVRELLPSKLLEQLEEKHRLKALRKSLPRRGELKINATRQVNRARRTDFTGGGIRPPTASQGRDAIQKEKLEKARALLRERWYNSIKGSGSSAIKNWAEGAGNKLKIIDGNVGGKVPVDDFNVIRKSSVKNSNADSITLGKYTNDSNSYIAKAGTDSSYFDLGNEWGVVQKKYNLTDSEMFEYFNKPALNDAISSGKTIKFSHNPLDYPDTFLEQEWDFIREALDLTDNNLIKIGDFWYVK